MRTNMEVKTYRQGELRTLILKVIFLEEPKKFV
jgi:hypothetical protein